MVLERSIQLRSIVVVVSLFPHITCHIKPVLLLRLACALCISTFANYVVCVTVSRPQSNPAPSPRGLKRSRSPDDYGGHNVGDDHGEHYPTLFALVYLP